MEPYMQRFICYKSIDSNNKQQCGKAKCKTFLQLVSETITVKMRLSFCFVFDFLYFVNHSFRATYTHIHTVEIVTNMNKIVCMKMTLDGQRNETITKKQVELALHNVCFS